MDEEVPWTLFINFQVKDNKRVKEVYIYFLLIFQLVHSLWEILLVSNLHGGISSPFA